MKGKKNLLGLWTALITLALPQLLFAGVAGNSNTGSTQTAPSDPGVSNLNLDENMITGFQGLNGQNQVSYSFPASIRVITVRAMDGQQLKQSRQEVWDAVFGSNSVHDIYQLSTQGAINLIPVFNQVQDVALRTSAQGACNLSSIETDVYQQLGLTHVGYDVLVILMPDDAKCAFAGITQVGTLGMLPNRSTIFINSNSIARNLNLLRQVIAHETGHTFGLEHAYMSVSIVNGTPVTPPQEGADGSALMRWGGNTVYDTTINVHSAQALLLAGWLPQNRLTAIPANDGILNLISLQTPGAPGFLAAISAGIGPDRSQFILSYMQKNGPSMPFGPSANEVVVQRTNASLPIGASHALAYLQNTGDRFIDIFSGTSFRVVGISGNRATVQVFNCHPGTVQFQHQSSWSIAAGGTLQAQFTITNHDPGSCGVTKFFTSLLRPTGTSDQDWSVAASPSTVEINPGQTVTITARISVSAKVAKKTYQLTMGASDQFHTESKMTQEITVK